jgi:2-keto-4-pentenoate hydratase/2-oxohepta-3-ene-1,7-dioic acid hydratase in catechol pathway
VARQTLSLTLQSGGASTRRDVGIDDVVVAGWTGRDPAAVEKHIKELEALGVKRPASTPIFYRVSAVRLTTGTEIEVVGTQSGGEVEFVLLQHDGRTWIGTGSDHTDREVETYGVTVSKQMCDKPVAPVFWAFDEVAPHWDQLRLRAHLVENGERKIYQEGPVTAMLAPADLIGRYLKAGSKLAENTLMFCGTLAARGGVRPTDRFEFEIEDPVLGRRIAHAYSVRVLPVLG